MPIVIWKKKTTPKSGDYCPIDRFHGLKTNGMRKITDCISRIKDTVNEPGWIGYTGNKRCIISGYM